jgi:hypothetical protein
MKATRILRAALLAAFAIICMPSFSMANENPSIPAHRQEQLTRLEQRLQEIRDTDVKQLSREERRALRGEVKQIKKEMKALSGGVYISIGALILIALLLILLA